MHATDDDVPTCDTHTEKQTMMRRDSITLVVVQIQISSNSGGGIAIIKKPKEKKTLKFIHQRFIVSDECIGNRTRSK